MQNPRSGLVAIVEDDEEMRRALRRILETEGYVTELHSTAEQYLLNPPKADVSCLVLDLHLPGMSGIELMGRLRAQERSVPTVLVTGFDVPLRWEKFTGADCCLLKPFAPEVLLQAVERCVARSGA